MKWIIEDNSRCDLAFFTGVNCSGREQLVRIFPAGRQGDVLGPFQSMKLGARPGLRVYLCTSTDDDAWMEAPWRCVRVLPGIGVKGAEGRPLVRVHDLDLYNEPHLLSMPHGAREGYETVERPEDGEGWTFGNGGGSLAGQIAMIRVVKERNPA